MKYTLKQFKKFATEIEAFENGEAIETYNEIDEEWQDAPNPQFALCFKYRVKPKLTREEITANWVKENDLKIGDKVKVLKGFEDSWAEFWQGCAGEAIGSICNVTYINTKWINIQYYQEIYSFPVECLEKVLNEWIPFDVEDFNIFRDKWLKLKSEAIESLSRINGINKNHKIILIGEKYIPLSEAFESYIFEDGTPFGKLKL